MPKVRVKSQTVALGRIMRGLPCDELSDITGRFGAQTGFAQAISASRTGRAGAILRPASPRRSIRVDAAAGLIHNEQTTACVAQLHGGTELPGEQGRLGCGGN
jgi:hypothetical protein